MNAAASFVSFRKRLTSWLGLSDSECNTGRQIVPDLAKGLAIVWMVPSHTLGLLAFVDRDEAVNPVAMFFDGILAGHLAAPVFMLCMGFGFAYARKLTPGGLAKRGLRILGLSVLLNLVRHVVPYLVVLACGGNRIATGWGWNADIFGGFSPADCGLLLIYNDILGFAGLAMLLFAAFFALKWRPPAIFAVCAGMSLAGTFLGDCTTGNIAVDMVSCYFVANNCCSFSLLGWAIFPAAGLWLGNALRHCENPTKFFLRCSLIALPFAAAYVCAMIFRDSVYPFSPLGEFGLMLPDALGGLTLDLSFLALLALLVRAFPRCEWTTLRRYSRNITAMYCIHWIILGLGVIVYRGVTNDFTSLPEIPAILAGVPLLLLSDFLSVVWNKAGRSEPRTPTR